MERAIPASKYSEKVVNSACLEITTGHTLTDACEKHGANRATFYRWLDAQSELRDAYARGVIDALSPTETHLNKRELPLPPAAPSNLGKPARHHIRLQW